MPLCLLAWYFDVAEDFSSRVVLTIIAGIVLVWSFFPNEQQVTPLAPSETRAMWGQAILIALTMWTGCIMAAGDKFDSQLLTAHSVLVFVSLVWFTFAWGLMRGSMLLLMALLLAIVIMMALWAVALNQYEGPQEFLLLPLPVGAFVGTIWVPFARWALALAGRQKDRNIYGPGSQTFAMLTLLFPAVFVAIALPIGLQLDENWVAVSLVLVGVVLSAVVGEPFRRFLIGWAGIRPGDK